MRLALRVALPAVLVASCAQVRDPQGGPKDITPPTLLSAEPPDGTTGFEAQRIVLHFDERIQLDNVREHLLISPPLLKPPDVTVGRGTDVIITLKAPLAPNTTYTFNIGEAVKDLSEGNVAAGLTYVISTGDHLDSLMVRGRVIDAFSDQPAAGVFVLLHDTADTVDVSRSGPAYFTRTDAQGDFKLTHLHAGRYRISALRDQNANYRYDLPNEDIAFAPPVVDPTDTLPWALFLFRPVPAAQHVLEARVNPDRGWRLVLARASPGADLRSLDREGGVLSWWPEWTTSRDTAVFWPSDTTLLADQRFVLLEQDSVIDTLTYRVTQRMPFNVTAQVVVDPVDRSSHLLTSRPLEQVDVQHMHLLIDSLEVPITASLDSTNARIVHLAPPPTTGKTGALTLLPHALRDRYRGENDTLHLSWGAQSVSSYGHLRITLKADSGTVLPGPWIMQLLDGQGNAVRQEAFAELPHTSTWGLIGPGSYTLKTIQDRNGDQRWTTGSFVARREPERTYVDPTPVNVRANWDVEVDSTIPK